MKYLKLAEEGIAKNTGFTFDKRKQIVLKAMQQKLARQCGNIEYAQEFTTPIEKKDAVCMLVVAGKRKRKKKYFPYVHSIPFSQ